MKFTLTVTKDLILRSEGCNARCCLMASAIGELVPCLVGPGDIAYLDKKGVIIAERPTTDIQKKLIEDFDYYQEMSGSEVLAKDRSFVNRKITVDIPDKVIEYWYGDAPAVVQKIINSSCIKALV